MSTVAKNAAGAPDGSEEVDDDTSHQSQKHKKHKKHKKQKHKKADHEEKTDNASQ